MRFAECGRTETALDGCESEHGLAAARFREDRRWRMFEGWRRIEGVPSQSKAWRRQPPSVRRDTRPFLQQPTWPTNRPQAVAD